MQERSAPERASTALPEQDPLDPQRRASLMERLVNLGETLTRPSSVVGAGQAIGRAALALSEGQRAAVYLRAASGVVTCLWSQGLSHEYVNRMVTPEGTNPWVHLSRYPDLLCMDLPKGRRAPSPEPVLVQDIRELPAGNEVRRVAESEGYYALGSWPLSRAGKVIGSVSCYYDAPHVWSRTEREVMIAFSLQAAALEGAVVLEARAQRAAQAEAADSRIAEARRVLEAESAGLFEAQKGLEVEQARLIHARKEMEAEHARLLALQNELKAEHARLTESRQEQEAEHARLIEAQSQQEAEHARLAEARREQEAEHARLAEVRRELEAEHARLTEARQDLEVEHARLAETRRELEADSARFTEAQGRLEAENDRLAETRRGLAAEDTRLSAAQKDLEAQQARLLSLQTELEAEQARLAASRREGATGADEEQARLFKAKQDLEAESARLAGTRKELDAEYGRLAGAQQALEAEHARVAEAQRTLEEEQARLAEMRRELEADHARHAEAQRELDVEHAGLSKARRELEAESARLTESRRELEAENARLSEAQQGLQAEPAQPAEGRRDPGPGRMPLPEFDRDLEVEGARIREGNGQGAAEIEISCALGGALPAGHAPEEMYPLLIERAATMTHKDRRALKPDQEVLTLARALDAHDAHRAGYSERLAKWAEAAARMLECREEEITDVRRAALLHDLGKIGVPEAVLQKPTSHTDEEAAVMRRAPIVAERVLRPVPGMQTVATILRHRHEQWDGKGYPGGRKGDEIPLAARILAVVDAYGEMTSGRPDRPMLYHLDAVAELRRGAGTQFDPQVVDVFCSVLKRERQENR